MQFRARAKGIDRYRAKERERELVLSLVAQ